MTSDVSISQLLPDVPSIPPPDRTEPSSGVRRRPNRDRRRKPTGQPRRPASDPPAPEPEGSPGSDEPNEQGEPKGRRVDIRA